MIFVNGQKTGAGSYAKLTRDILDALGTAVAEHPRNFETCINLCPPQYYAHTAGLNLALAAFEGSKAPKSWIYAAKQQDGLFTFSEHNEAAFGLRMKIMKPPIALDKFTLGNGNSGGPTRVLFVGQVDERKNLNVLIEAAKAKEMKDFEFLLHLVKVSHGKDAPVVQHVKLTGADVPKNVKCTDSLLTDKQIVELYGSADIYVLPTRAEGWQQTSLEALACGCNVAITDEPSANCLKRRSGVYFIKSQICEPSKRWCDDNANSHYGFDWYDIAADDIIKTLLAIDDKPTARDKCRKSVLDFDVKNVANELWRLCA